jgi:lysophospholipase L1-like esterase
MVLAAALSLSACDDDKLMRPQPVGGPLFARVVAIGNSITAGFQSGGMNDSTQRQSYAALVAEALGTAFDIPLLDRPGCPPPIVNVFTEERVGGGGGGDCALRTRPIPVELNNVAVPGAAVIDVLTNFDEASDPNPLTTILLGGRSQLQAAAEVEPTFAMVWIGNNDVLGAALQGDTGGVTPLAEFDARYRTMADSLSDLGLEGAVLVAVVDVTLIPHLSPGAAYWQAEQMGQLPPTFDVAANCSPLDPSGSALVPFSYGFGELFARASEGEPVTLDCVNDARLLTAQEIAAVQAAVNSYNETIADLADQNGWAFYDPNPEFQARKEQGEVPLFPNVPPDPDAVAHPFGELFSKDGVHPSALAHEILADRIIDAINERYGTAIPLSD